VETSIKDASMNTVSQSVYPERPLSYNVLCVLAFGFGGISIMVNLFLILSGSLAYAYREFPVMMQLLGSAAEYNGMIYSVLGLILSIVAFLGVIQMWHQMRSGFWIFTFSKLAYAVLPFILLDIPVKHLIHLMLPFYILVIFFVTLFSYNLKHMQ
jgi:hypothetical protein